MSILRSLLSLFMGIVLLASCSSVNNPINITTTHSDANAGGVLKPFSSQMLRENEEGEQTAIFAGGCFWGVEGVFEHIKGVSDVTSGFSFGKATTGNKGIDNENAGRYAEAVKVTYEPSKVTYQQLLEIFFLVAHDPTELNRQGPDVGTEYRSAIFYSNDKQKQLAENYVAELTQAKTFAQPIVTQIIELDKFNRAGDEHQDYMTHHPDVPYIVINDKPKLEKLRQRFPDLYVPK